MKIIGSGTSFPTGEGLSYEGENLRFDSLKAKSNEEDLIMDFSLPLCEKVLEKAKIKPEEIDLLLSISITPDRLVGDKDIGAPRLCHPLQRELKAKNAFVFDLLDSDWNTAIEIADGFAKDQGYKNVLIIRAELSSFSIKPDAKSGFSIPEGFGVLLLENDGGELETSYESITNNGEALMEMLPTEELCKNVFKTQVTFNINQEMIESINTQSDRLLECDNLSKDSLVVKESWFPGHNEKLDFKYGHLGPFTLPFQAEKILDNKALTTEDEALLSITFNPFLLRSSVQKLSI
jgi:hypothetical protein